MAIGDNLSPPISAFPIAASFRSYELSDGQIRSEVGTYRDVKDAEGKDVKALFVQGSYSFVGPDGQTYWVNYTADENGYHPKVGTGPTGGIQAGQDAPVASA